MKALFAAALLLVSLNANAFDVLSCSSSEIIDGDKSTVQMSIEIVELEYESNTIWFEYQIPWVLHSFPGKLEIVFSRDLETNEDQYDLNVTDPNSSWTVTIMGSKAHYETSTFDAQTGKRFDLVLDCSVGSAAP
ncbi:MAG: hypothetical protein V4760_09895 [Bdellovibrionota bacterium]